MQSNYKNDTVELDETGVIDDLPENLELTKYARVLPKFKKSKQKTRSDGNYYIPIYSDFETMTEEVVQAYSEKGGTEPDAKITLGCSVCIDGYDRTQPADIAKMLANEDIVMSTNIEEGLCNFINLGIKKHFEKGYISDKQKSHTVNLIGYFHNLKFDENFIVKFLKQNGGELVSDITKLDQNATKKFCKFGHNKTYRTDLKLVERINGHRFRINIALVDSLKILSSSVEALGKTSKMTVGKFATDENGDKIPVNYHVGPENDYKKYDRNYGEYCIRDCLIIAEATENFFEHLNGLESIKVFDKLRSNKNEKCKPTDLRMRNGLSFTVAGVCRKILQILSHNFIVKNEINKKHINKVRLPEKSDLFTKQPYKNYKQLQPFYYGGLTQFSTKHDQPILDPENYMSNSIDVNSAYPYGFTKDVPYGDILTTPPKTGTYITFKVIRIDSGKTFDKGKHFPIMKNGPKVSKHNYHELFNLKNDDAYSQMRSDVDMRYITEITEPVYAFFIQDEGDAVLKTGTGKYEVVHQFYMQSTDKVFADFFNELYQVRASNKKTNPAYAQTLKIVLNASYGCTALRTDFAQFLLIDDGNKRPEFVNDSESGGVYYANIVEKGKEKKCVFKYFDIDNKELLKSDLYNAETSEEKNPVLGNGMQKNNITDVDKKTIYKMRYKHADDIPENQLCVNKAIALTITARQRAYVINTIEALGADYVRYCDTDSIYFINVPIEIGKQFEKQYCDDSKLGKGKVEHKNEFMVYLKSVKAKNRTTSFIPIQDVEKYKQMTEVERDDFIKKRGGYSITFSGLNIVGDLKHLTDRERDKVVAERSVDIKNLIEIGTSGQYQIDENSDLSNVLGVDENLDERLKLNYGKVITSNGKVFIEMRTNNMITRQYRSGQTLVPENDKKINPTGNQ